MPAMAGQKALCLKRRRLTPYPHAACSQERGEAPGRDFDFLMRYLPKLPDDSYAKTETLKILKQHKAYMAQFEEMLNDEKIA